MKTRYIEGITDNGWVTWRSVQKVYNSDYFIHSTHYLQGNPAESSKNIIKNILQHKNKNRRSNLRIAINGNPDNPITWDTVQPYVNTETPRGSSFYVGAHPAIIWQNPLNGKWTMATGYGVSIGFEVEIKKQFDWRLREKPLIAWIYFLGPGMRSNRYDGLNNILKRKEVIMPWYNVHLDVWGKLSDTGMEMGGARWQPLSGYNGGMRIGGISVIRDPAPTAALSTEWKSWAVKQLKDGKGIAYQTRANNASKGKLITVWQNGTKTSDISSVDYKRINEEITVNIEHDKNGRILYKRQ